MDQQPADLKALESPVAIESEAKEIVSQWLNINTPDKPSFDEHLEEIVTGTSKKIVSLRALEKNALILKEILKHETDLLSILSRAVDFETHEGRFFQTIATQEDRIDTAFELLHLEVSTNPLAFQSNLEPVLSAIDFDLRSWKSLIPLEPPLNRITARSTLRDLMLGYAEKVTVPLTFGDWREPAAVDEKREPILKVTYADPRVSESLVGSGLEAIRIFFEVDSSFPSYGEQQQLKCICRSIAQGMTKQANIYFRKLLESIDSQDSKTEDLERHYCRTYVAIDRAGRFIRRIFCGINPSSSENDLSHQAELSHCLTQLNSILGEVIASYDQKRLKKSLTSFAECYNDLINEKSSRGKYFRSDPYLLINLRTLVPGF